MAYWSAIPAFSDTTGLCSPLKRDISRWTHHIRFSLARPRDVDGHGARTLSAPRAARRHSALHADALSPAIRMPPPRTGVDAAACHQSLTRTRCRQHFTPRRDLSYNGDTFPRRRGHGAAYHASPILMPSRRYEVSSPSKRDRPASSAMPPRPRRSTPPSPRCRRRHDTTTSRSLGFSRQASRQAPRCPRMPWPGHTAAALIAGRGRAFAGRRYDDAREAPAARYHWRAPTQGRFNTELFRAPAMSSAPAACRHHDALLGDRRTDAARCYFRLLGCLG